MANFNKVILAGNLCTDVQYKLLPSQTPVAEFRLAVNRKYKTAAGEQRDEALFVDCTVFGPSAENVRKFCQKGKPLLVEGRLKYDTWESEGHKRSKHSVVVESFQFLGTRDADGGDRQDRPPQRQSAPRQGRGDGIPADRRGSPFDGPADGEEKQFNEADIPF